METSEQEDKTKTTGHEGVGYPGVGQAREVALESDLGGRELERDIENR